MNSASTALNIDVDFIGPIPSSGAWQLDAPAENQLRSFANAPTWARAFPLVFTISTVTWGSDPSFVDARHLYGTTIESYREQISSRSVSLAEARAIALEIMRSAEFERSRFAEEEARRGVNWEDEY